MPSARVVTIKGSLIRRNSSSASYLLHSHKPQVKLLIYLQHSAANVSGDERPVCPIIQVHSGMVRQGKNLLQSRKCRVIAKNATDRLLDEGKRRAEKQYE